MQVKNAPRKIKIWQILILVIIIGAAWIKINHIAIIKILPDEVILSDLDDDQRAILQNEIGFELPEGAQILQGKISCTREGYTIVRISGIQNIDAFVHKDCRMSEISCCNNLYTSPFIDKNFEGCCIYTGIDTIKGHKRRKEVGYYNYNGVNYVEICSDGVCDDETSELFESIT